MIAGLIIIVLFFSSAILCTNAWDIAVAVGNQVEFLNISGDVEGKLSEGMAEVRALAYNADLHRLYFSDEERLDGSIFQLTVPKAMTINSVNVTVSTVVSKQVHGVKGVAYDDRTGILYWSNGPGHSILWIQVGSTDEPQTGQPLLKVEDQIPMGIAIDNCKRYLYWTNCGKIASIERSLLDGSSRQTLTNDDLVMPYAVVVDQTTERIYWVDERPGAEYRIESANLNGKDRRVIIAGSDHQPFALAVSNGQVFWADHIHTSVWRLPLDSPHSTSADHPIIVAVYRSSPKALVSVSSGVWTRENCNPVIQPVMKVIPATVTKTVVEQPASGVNMTHPMCLNKGLWKTDQGYCDCLPGYSGALCEVDECLDYCVQGVCHITEHLGRECVCVDGYTGTRCEVSVCHNYCITGSCSVDLTGQPQCHCREGYSGDRCEVNFTQQQEARDSLQEVCLAFCKLWTQSAKEDIQPFDMCRCPEVELISAELKWSWRSDHTLLGVTFLCVVLFVAVVLLTKEVVSLRKRPRFKKRIIVNKNVTPLTCQAGTEQPCEITIENCCNMNICETPCFEPDFRHPQITNGKPSQNSKEEKRTLLGNMELPPDDLY